MQQLIGAMAKARLPVGNSARRSNRSCHYHMTGSTPSEETIMIGDNMYTKDESDQWKKTNLSDGGTGTANAQASGAILTRDIVDRYITGASE